MSQPLYINTLISFFPLGTAGTYYTKILSTRFGETFETKRCLNILLNNYISCIEREKYFLEYNAKPERICFILKVISDPLKP